MAITQNGSLKRDDNDQAVMGGTSSVDNATIINSSFDPTTRRLLVDAGSAGSTLTFKTPTGTVNGINDTFTVANTPLFIVSDGATYFDGAGYTIVGTTVTMSMPPVSFIRDAYNA